MENLTVNRRKRFSFTANRDPSKMQVNINRQKVSRDFKSLTLPGFLYNVSRLMHSAHFKRTATGLGINFLRDEKIEEP